MGGVLIADAVACPLMQCHLLSVHHLHWNQLRITNKSGQM